MYSARYFSSSRQSPRSPRRPPPAQPIAVTPASGIGLTAPGPTYTFSFTFSDSNGIANLSVADVLINDYLDGLHACWVALAQPTPGSFYLYLVDDLDDMTHYVSGSPMLLPSSGSLTNSQCTINGTGSSVSASGQWLNLTLAVTFKSAFVGNQIIYAAAEDSVTGRTSGWEAVGSWTVPTLPTVTGPSAVSVFPGRGPDQMAADGSTTMTFTFGDSSGWASLAVVDVLINGPLDGTTACYFAFVPTGSSSGYLYLVDDAGDGGYVFGSPMYMDPTHGTVLHNTQCSINVAGSTVSASGNRLTLTMNVTFFPSATIGGFNGNVAIYLAARDNGTGNSGWQALGSWYVGTSTSPSVVLTTNLSDFQTCIGPSSAAVTCMLAPGRYPVPLPATGQAGLQIGRSNVIIAGGGGPGDTILYRDAASLTYIMEPNAAVSHVTISNLTFDGNRYGFGTGATGAISCLPGNAGLDDLATDVGSSYINVEWDDFINAPGTALVLAGYGSTVSTSSFGQGGFGVGPGGGTAAPETVAGQTATRSTAVYANDSYNGAYYNNIAYAGTAGITLNGANQTAYGNMLFQNRYELSDWAPVGTARCLPGGCLEQGGQLVLTGDITQTLTGGCPGHTCSSNATVAGNVIVGNNWPPLSGPPYPAQATGCPWGTGGAYNAGVEAYGFGHFFYNNESNTHTGSGMQLAGSNPTGNITISSANIFNSSDPTRSVEGNSASGIVFLGPISNSSFIYPAVGVTLDDVVVQNNNGVGVALDTVSNNGTYIGFVNNACLSGPLQADTSPRSWTTLSNYAPTSDNAFRGGACPTSGYSTPPRSYIPGWSW